MLIPKVRNKFYLYFSDLSNVRTWMRGFRLRSILTACSIRLVWSVLSLTFLDVPYILTVERFRKKFKFEPLTSTHPSDLMKQLESPATTHPKFYVQCPLWYLWYHQSFHLTNVWLDLSRTYLCNLWTSITIS